MSLQQAQRRTERGTALAVVLLLMPVATLLAVSAMMTATLELRMAANAQQQERAFQAAEFAIEQAVASTDLGTAYTYASPKLVPAAGAQPPAMPGSTSDTYSYRLYFDPAPGGAGTPEEAARAGLVAYHFIVEASGTSARGAHDTHVQGIYVLHPPGWIGATTPCTPPDCAALPASSPERTFWRQQDAE